MPHHTLSSDVVHYEWDNSLPPRLLIESGDTVTFHTRDARDGTIGPQTPVQEVVARSFRGHPLTGPVAIADAEPGDTLQIDILALEHGPFGFTTFAPGKGLLPDDFDEPYLHTWDLTQDPTPLRPGIAIPIEPFLGVLGTAPLAPGPHSTVPPRSHGGNIDVKQLTVGSSAFLPVFVPGALFSCGDGHAAQGDGEVCLTAIETTMVATLRLTVLKGRQVPELQFRTAGPLASRTNTAGWYATTAHGPDLLAASRRAIRYMLDYLEREHGLSRQEAYILCSVAVDLRISEVVDAPNWIVSALLPLSVFQGVDPVGLPPR